MRQPRIKVPGQAAGYHIVTRVNNQEFRLDADMKQGFINYLFHLVMGIMLTPTQYGTLYSLLSLLVILSIVSSTIHTSVTKFASKFKAHGNLGGVNYLWRFSLKRTFLIGLVSFLILSLLSPLLATFLNITNIWYLLFLFLSLILTFVLPVNYGILRGLQRFIPLGSSNTLMAILKLATGALLVYLGLGVYGGLLAFIIAQLIVFIFTLYFLRDLTSAGAEKIDTGGLRAYVGLALLAIAAFTVLTNVDVILVKHYLSPETTGSYSAIAVLGKIAFIVPGGIVVAMFPKTSELYETNATHHRVLLKAALLGIRELVRNAEGSCIALRIGLLQPLARGVVSLFSIACTMTNHLVGHAVIQATPTREDMIHVDIAVEELGNADLAPTIGAVLLLFLP